MKALLTVLVGVSSLILATQLTLVSFEQFSPPSTANPTTKTVQTYTPPDFGAPARTLGSATR